MIHQFKQAGLAIVVDVFSGSIHLVDDVAYDIVALYESNTKDQIVTSLAEKYSSTGVSQEEIAECYDEITWLKDEGKLKKLLVAGCLTQRYPDDIRTELPEVDGMLVPAAIPMWSPRWRS